MMKFSSMKNWRLSKRQKNHKRKRETALACDFFMSQINNYFSLRLAINSYNFNWQPPSAILIEFKNTSDNCTFLGIGKINCVVSIVSPINNPTPSKISINLPNEKLFNLYARNNPTGISINRFIKKSHLLIRLKSQKICLLAHDPVLT